MRGDGLLKKIQIKNVRSLKDTGEIALPPVTLLVGENSSGKSTFLRTFPLIKQSICKRTDGPLLWAGDVDDYVDFGSFSETVTNDGADTISFRFAFSLPAPRPMQDFYQVRPHDVLSPSGETDDILYDITIAPVSRKEQAEYVSDMAVRVNDVIFSFAFEPDGRVRTLRVNGIQLQPKEDQRKDIYMGQSAVYARQESLFGVRLPDIGGLVVELFDGVFQNKKAGTSAADVRMRFYFAPIVQTIGSSMCRGYTLDKLPKELEKQLDQDVKAVFRQTLTALNGFEPERRVWAAAVCRLYAFYCRYSQIDRYLDTYFRQVHYVAPLRATAERYYRLRNLAIDEVDYQGKNLPVFLNGLSAARLKSFQAWTQEHFGFQVQVKKEGGHLSVRIALGSDPRSINMSDTGFGYSQILPIITQLWYLSTAQKPDREQAVPLVIAIEQPELHLHPALQAKLVDAFIASIHLAQEHGRRLQLIIETHSETIVNQFGSAIARGRLAPSEASLLLFEKDYESNITTVHTSAFDRDGYLNDWPIGFFSPEVAGR